MLLVRAEAELLVDSCVLFLRSKGVNVAWVRKSQDSAMLIRA